MSPTAALSLIVVVLGGAAILALTASRLGCKVGLEVDGTRADACQHLGSDPTASFPLPELTPLPWSPRATACHDVLTDMRPVVPTPIPAIRMWDHSRDRYYVEWPNGSTETLTRAQLAAVMPPLWKGPLG